MHFLFGFWKYKPNPLINVSNKNDLHEPVVPLNNTFTFANEANLRK
jgi:hypothetical protein